jgi:hypothetical protein
LIVSEGFSGILPCMNPASTDKQAVKTELSSMEIKRRTRRSGAAGRNRDASTLQVPARFHACGY